MKRKRKSENRSWAKSGRGQAFTQPRKRSISGTSASIDSATCRSTARIAATDGAAAGTIVSAREKGLHALEAREQRERFALDERTRRESLHARLGPVEDDLVAASSPTTALGRGLVFVFELEFLRGRIRRRGRRRCWIGGRARFGRCRSAALGAHRARRALLVGDPAVADVAVGASPAAVVAAQEAGGVTADGPADGSLRVGARTLRERAAERAARCRVGDAHVAARGSSS